MAAAGSRHGIDARTDAARGAVRELWLLYGDTFADNVPMLELARRLGFEKRRHPTDARLARMSVGLDGLKEAASTAADTSRAAYSLASVNGD